MKTMMKTITAATALLITTTLPALGEENKVYSTTIEQVPLYTERNTNVQSFTDIPHGFKLLRPFGFNEFDGAGSGYLVKFSSLFDSK